MTDEYLIYEDFSIFVLKYTLNCIYGNTVTGV